jgi:hypothetical protein
MRKYTIVLVAMAMIAAPVWLYAQATTQPATPTASVDHTPAVAILAKTAINMTLGKFTADETTLDNFITYIRTFTGANVLVDWKVLEAAGVARTTTIQLTLADVTVKKALATALAQAAPTVPMDIGVEDNVIHITTQAQADTKLITKVYPLDDLVLMSTPMDRSTVPSLNLAESMNGGVSSSGGNSKSSGGSTLFQPPQQAAGTPAPTAKEVMQNIVDTIQTTVRPEIWQAGGGKGSIKAIGNKLIISAPRSVHETIGGTL